MGERLQILPFIDMVAIALEMFREAVDEHEDWISGVREYWKIGFWLLPHRKPFEGRQSYAGRNNRCFRRIAADKNSRSAAKG